MAQLLVPVEFNSKAELPKAELASPVVLADRAL